MAVTLLVGVWLARYLGAEQFGLMNYTLALVSIFGTISNLGMNGVVVRDLVKSRKDSYVTLGTAFALRILGGIVSFVLVLIAIKILQPQNALAQTLVTILAVTFLFRSTEVITYWFESQVQSKYSVWAESAAFLLISGLKILLILAGAPLITFIWMFLIESVFQAVLLLTIYSNRTSSLHFWRISITRAKALLKDSLPLVISSMAVIVYMRIDQIMLGNLLDVEAVGIYSAAVKITESFFFVPMAIVASAFPTLMQNSKNGVISQKLQALFDIMLLISLPLALTLYFLAEPIVAILFTEQYTASATILRIHAWVVIFAFLGVPAGRWYVYENLQTLAMYRTLSGAAMNILANYILIPIYGAQGAAYATLFSYIMANMIFNLLNKSTRPLFFMQVRSVLQTSMRNRRL